MADIDELKATFAQKVATIPSRDANAYAAFWHEQAPRCSQRLPATKLCKAFRSSWPSVGC